MRKALVVAYCLGPALLWACGSSLGGAPVDGGSTDGTTDHSTTVEAGEPDSGSDGSPKTDGSPGSDGTTTGDSTTKEGGPGKETGAKDVVEEPPACVPASTDDSTGIYVVSSGGADGTTCGTRTSPCATVAYALTTALGNPTYQYIYVGPGTFNETEQLNLVNGVSVIGGWLITTMTTWSHDCVAPTINVTVPVMASGLTSPTTLDTLDIVNTAPTPTAGASLYGLMSDSSSLVLNDVSISVSNPAGDGAPGTSATTSGTAGAAGGCTPAGTGDPGGPGGVGTASGAGTFNPPPTGYTAAGAGGGGTVGGSGSNGVSVAPTPVPVTVTTHDLTGTCPACTCNCMDAGVSSIVGTAGIPGCAGGGGPGGLSGGSGGGCNIALYAWGGSVTMSGGSLTSGAGGAGGPGGTGGPGGGGAAGTTGADAGVTYCDLSGHIVCSYKTYDAPGSTAGAGGKGGTGGQGGGSAGGCSYAYYSGSGATVTTTGTTINHGAGGVLGAPNGTAGPSGPHN